MVCRFLRVWNKNKSKNMKKNDVIKEVREQIKEDRSHDDIRQALLSKGADESLVDKVLSGFGNKSFRKQFSSQNHILIAATIFITILKTMMLLLAMLGSLSQGAEVMLVYVFALFVGWVIVLWLVKLFKYFQKEGYIAALILLLLSAKNMIADVNYAFAGPVDIIAGSFIFLNTLAYFVILIFSIKLLLKFNKTQDTSGSEINLGTS